MSAERDGGPAFPVIFEHSDGQAISEQFGMTMRDYFAAKALGGMLTDLPKVCYGLDWQDKVTRTAYELADAMLRAREGDPQ
jgi:hypothetical protein